MKRYSKPLGKLLDFKQEFFNSNDSKLEEFRRIAAVYRSQPRRAQCKNCGKAMDFPPSACFTKLEVDYSFCPQCGHLNGAYEDTEVFCRSLYSDDSGESYAGNYSAADIQQYQSRVLEIYAPKAEFLKAALAEAGQPPVRLADFGAGAGYFVSAAKQCGFSDAIGYEPSETLVNLGNTMIGSGSLIRHDLEDLVSLIERCDAAIASFIFVFEHLQSPRAVLQALSKNERVRYIYFSVPIFSPATVIESVFAEIMPRNLVAGHTHLYTERSIQAFCDEFGFERLSEWWFGLDMTDFYRSVLVSLQKADTANVPLQTYWTEQFLPLIDKLQTVLDQAHACTEVHMLLGKK
jgi:hypothetical protein